MAGITAVGAYIPIMRLKRSAILEAHGWYNGALKGHAKGERAFGSWDEDTITMAVEAARDCLVDVDRNVVSTVSLASTTAPNADRQNSGIIKEALNLSDEVASLDNSGGQRAGTSALIQALNSTEGTGQSTLCIASERRKARPASEAEMTSGDAAAALLIGRDEPLARFIGSHSVTADFVDHFRSSDAAFDYDWESRWIREEGYGKLAAGAVEAALKKCAIEPSSIDHFILAAPGRGNADLVAKKVGIKIEAIADSLMATVGYAGAAHPLLMLVHAIERSKAGQTILLVGFGQGCDVLLFEVTDKINHRVRNAGVSGSLLRRRDETNYMKFLSFNQLIELDRGMRAEIVQKQPLTALYRNRKAVFGLVGGRCTRTGTIQYPKTDISVDRQDPAVGTQEDYPLAERSAHVVSFTSDSLAYSPDPPTYYGMIEFDGGGRMMAEIVDVAPEDVEVGVALKMVFRIKGVDEIRDFKRYFWKAVPIVNQGENHA